MKYTANGESWLANIAQGEAKSYICHKTHQQLYTFIEMKWSGTAVSVLLYFITFKEVLIKYTSLKFAVNTIIE